MSFLISFYTKILMFELMFTCGLEIAYAGEASQSQAGQEVNGLVSHVSNWKCNFTSIHFPCPLPTY